MVDDIVTAVLSNKIFQRKQSSQFWILEVQNNKWNALITVQSVSGERFIAVLKFSRIRRQISSRQIDLYGVTTI